MESGFNTISWRPHCVRMRFRSSKSSLDVFQRTLREANGVADSLARWGSMKFKVHWFPLSPPAYANDVDLISSYILFHFNKFTVTFFRKERKTLFSRIMVHLYRFQSLERTEKPFSAA